MNTYEGYFENGRFVPVNLVPAIIPERRRAFITILDEPARNDEATKRLAALDAFFQAIDASDEKIPEAFERVNFLREIDL